MALFDVFEVKVYCTLGDQTSVNALHFAVSAIAGTGSTDAMKAVRLDDSLGPLMKSCISTSARYAGLAVQKIFPLPKGAQAFANAQAGGGSAGATILPTQTSGLLSFYTGLAGRRQRGRMYVPFPTETSNVDATGLPSITYQGALDNLAADLLGGYVSPIGGGANSDTLSLVIWHRATFSYNTVATHRSRLRWATQRRRGSYGRPNPSPV